MAPKLKHSTRSNAVPLFAATVPAQLDTYVPGDKLPEPEVIEKDSDSVWAMWSDAINGPAEPDSEQLPATRIMGLDELPNEPDA